MTLAPTSPALLLSDVLLGLHTQPTFAAVMEALVRATRRLGLRCGIGCLIRDPGTDAWHLTALWDDAPTPGPLDLRSLGVPLGPFPFVPPAAGTVEPVERVFGHAWGLQACAALARRLVASGVLCAPVPGAEAPQGALLALLPDAAPVAVLSRVLAHAAVAAAARLERERTVAGDGVLEPAALAAVAEEELARARRYGRPLTVVALRVERLAELAGAGRLVGAHLGRWDRVGRLATTTPALALVLPETDRAAALAFVARLRSVLAGACMAAAVFPEDGCSFTQLVDLALGRSALTSAPAAPGRAPDRDAVIERWTRGAPVGPGQDTVRCPRCLVSYSRRVPGSLPSGALERMHAILQTMLHQSCPEHPAQLDLPQIEPRPFPTGHSPIAA
jgi:hypothetical protein